MARTYAYCFASGHIEFGPTVPDGALQFARGRDTALRNFIEPLARHGYKTELVDGRPTKIPGTDMLLVPGIPETRDQREKLAALHAFMAWIGKRPPRGIAIGAH